MMGICYNHCVRMITIQMFSPSLSSYFLFGLLYAASAGCGVAAQANIPVELSHACRLMDILLLVSIMMYIRAGEASCPSRD